MPLAWWLALGCGTTAAATAETTAFRVLTDEAGVYRLDFETLRAAGLDREVPATDLSMDGAGSAVPIWVADGGDGRFGPGDWIEFAAERLLGRHGNLHELASHNVYWLRLVPGPRMAEGTGIAGSSTSAAPLERRLRLERDELMARLSALDIAEDPEPELWFWAKLTHLDRGPFSLPLELDGLDAAAGALRLRLRFRALSEHQSLPAGVPSHVVQASLDDGELATLSWSGKQPMTLDLPTIAIDPTRSEVQLRLGVPRRRLGDDPPVIDVVLLAAVEISYPHDGSVGDEQVRLSIAGRGTHGVLRTARPGVVAYSDAGRRAVLPPGIAALPLEDGEAELWLVPPGAARTPALVEVARASTWIAVDRHADYLIVAHRSLTEAIEPLAEFHRGNGLDVEVIDVQDLYDELNHGIAHPVAIRRFVAHAWSRWRRPAPRYVLLVGDASWDVRDATIDESSYASWTDRQLLAVDGRFPAREIHSYDGIVGRGRNLIPAPSYQGSHGHAASDNWYAAIDDDDPLPVLAIGRFPVAAPAEVSAIVDKTIRYAASPPVGPWRRRALWIANEQELLQRLSDHLASSTVAHGLASTKIYPSPDEPSNEAHQAAILRAFDSGQYLVHFVGHGGRFIWRTGPPGPGKDHDLFTLDHLDALAPSERLPVVLSMTCHSGPFDHPSADSIGEKLLRVADRGAVAVVSPSWRVAPTPLFSKLLVEELSRARRVGDAFVAAKRRHGFTRRRDLQPLRRPSSPPAVATSRGDGRHARRRRPGAAGRPGPAGPRWTSPDRGHRP